MTVVAIVASALGGGVVASLLESWFASLRAYETARWLILSELAAMESLSHALGMPESGPVDLSRVSYPTGAWRQNRALLATRLSRSEPKLFGQLAGFFAVIESTRPTGPLYGDSLETLRMLRRELARARLGAIGETVVYGARYAFRRRRKLRALRKRAKSTGAQTGAQEPDSA